MTGRLRITVARPPGPELVIDDAMAFARAAVKAADEAGIGDFDLRARYAVDSVVDDADIRVMNGRMATRADTPVWVARMREASPWIDRIPITWSPVRIEPDSPQAREAVDLIANAIDRAGARWPYVAVVTKLLHLRRPHLVPIIDSYLLDQLGGGGGLTNTIERIHREAWRNREPLAVIADRLADHRLRRSELRILETCLWASHPRNPARLTADWTAVIRPTAEA